MSGVSLGRRRRPLTPSDRSRSTRACRPLRRPGGAATLPTGRGRSGTAARATSRPVSDCSDCCAWCSERSCSVSADALPTRFFSTSCSLTSTLVSDSERLDEVLDGLLPAVEVDTGRLLEFAERRLREIQERLVVLPERVGRQRREVPRAVLFRVLQQGELFGRCPAFGRQLGLEPRARRGELGGKLRSDAATLAIRLRSHDEPHADGEQRPKARAE